MSEQELIRQYQDRQDREFREWLAKPAPAAAGPASADRPKPTAGAEQQGPPEPPGVWGAFWQTFTETYGQGLKHAAEGGALPGRVPNPANAGKGAFYSDKVGALGWLEMMSALPAGAGAAVQRAMQKYTPGLESTPMPGLGGRRDPNDQPTVASYLRTLIALPQILLDPKMAGFSWPELSRALDDPITYGEFFNIAAAFASGAAAGKLNAKVSGLQPRMAGAGAAEGRAPLALPATTEMGLARVEPQVIQGQRIPRGPEPAPQAGPMAQPASTAAPAGALPPQPRLALPPAPEGAAGAPVAAPASSRGPVAALPPHEAVNRFQQLASDPELAVLRQEMARRGPATGEELAAGTPRKPLAKAAGRTALAPGAAEEIAQATETNGGASYSLSQGKLHAGTEGYAVSVAPERGVVVDGTPTPQVLEKFASDNREILSDPRAYLGTWKDDTGKTHLDISIITPDAETAHALGREHKQLAVWDFKNGQEIKVTQADLGHPYPKAAEPLDQQAVRAAQEYDRAMTDPAAKPAWDALATETDRMFDEISQKITIEKVTGQPYDSAEAMHADIRKGVLKVTTDNSEHPFWNEEQNFKFRAVHDYLGHFEGGNDFSLAGEYKAFVRHADQLQNDAARGALQTEVYGQAAAAVAHNEFQPQKAFVSQERVGGTPAESRLTPGTAPDTTRVFRNGAEGRVMSETPETAMGEGPLHYADVPPDSSLGNGQHYLYDSQGKPIPYFGEVAEPWAAKVEAAKTRLYDAYDRVVKDLTNEKGAIDLRGDITETMKKNGQVMNDLATVGAAILWEGHRKLPEFTQKLVADYGELAGAHAPEILKMAQEKLAKIIDQARFGLPSTKQLLKLHHEGEYGQHWYNEAATEFKNLFGVHWELYADVLAATSPNATVASNIAKANKYTALILTGEKFADRGGWFVEDMEAVNANLNRVLKGEPLSGPKVGAFAAALKGDPNAVVVDTWMHRAFGFADSSAPLEKFSMTRGAHNFMVKTITDMADRLGVEPRQVQAAMWVAKKVRDEGLDIASEAGRPIGELVREKLEGSDLAEILGNAVKKPADGGDMPSWITEDGRVDLATMLTLSRAVIGGAIGGMTGDTPEEAMRNALIGMGLGAAASTTVARKIVERLKSIDPEGAKLTSFTSGVDPMNLADAMKKLYEGTIRRRATSERDFNYGRMDATTQTKNLIRTLDENIEALKQFRTRTHAETVKLAEGSKYNNVSEILKLGPDTPLSGPDYYAARNVMIDVAESAIRAAVQEDAPKVRDTIALLGEVASRVKDVRTSIARAEESGRIEAKATDLGRLYDLDAVAKGVAETKLGLQNLDDVALLDAVKRMANANKVGALARHLKAAPSAWWEIYYGLNLLSSPWTQFRNVIGNTAAVAFGIGDRLVGEAVSPAYQLVGAKGPHIAFGESWDLAREIGLNIRNGFRAAKQNWQTGDSFIGPSKASEALSLSANATNAADVGIEGAIHGKFFNAIAALARGNLRFMGAVDEFYKYVQFAGELAAQARRTAVSEGLAGDAKVARMSELQERPTTEMLLAAKAFANEQTFAKEFQPGTLGARLQNVAEHPAARLTLTPFFRTPMRLAEYSNVHTPGLNLVSKQFYSDIAAGGAKAELAWGKLAVGGALVYGVAQLAQDGYITGNGPTDPALRKHMLDAGWQPQSIYNPISKTYHSYANLDPITTPVSYMADLIQIGSEIPDASYGELFTAWSLAMAKDVGGKTYWQPISDLLDVIDGLAKTGSDGAARNALKLLANQVSKFTPGAGLVHTARQITDPIQREPRTLQEFFAAQVPGWSQTVPARRNMITGEPIPYEGVFGEGSYAAGLSPWRVSTDKEDLVLNEIVRQGGAGLPREIPRVIGGSKPPETVRLKAESPREGVLLSESQRARLTTLLTQDVKDPYGLTLHQAMTSLVAQQGPYAVYQYNSQSEGRDGGKGIALYGIWHRFLTAAEQRLLSEDKPLADQVRRRRLDRALGKLPPPIQQQLRPALEGVMRP